MKNKFEFSLKNKFLQNALELLLAAFIAFLFPFWIAKIQEGSVSHHNLISPVHAQTMSPERVAKQVYEKMPKLPKENQYISEETNEINERNTLVSRIVRYHQYVKTRPTAFRLDWKLTLADYLDANEIIKDNRYPGSTTLIENPLLKDKEVIDTLTRNQRDELVNILVGIYNPKSNINSNVDSSSEENSSPSKNNSSREFVLPTPGGADLLLP